MVDNGDICGKCFMIKNPKSNRIWISIFMASEKFSVYVKDYSSPH